jgi:hypothetical protein
LYFLLWITSQLISSLNKKKYRTVRCWWLTPVILATQEAEIKRIKIQSQPQQIVLKTVSKKNHHKKGLVAWLKL